MPDTAELLAAYALPDRVAPRIRMNFVQSADGAATLDGRSGPLGGDTDREVMQVLRTMADVVLVGAGTVRVEGYGTVALDAARSRWRREHGLPAQPAFAIVSGDLRLDPRAPVFADADERPTIITRADAPAERRAALEPVAEVIACGAGRVDLAGMQNLFTARGWAQVLCEGGPHLFGALLEAGLVDEVCLTIAPRFVAGDARRIARGAPERDRRFALAGVVTDDEGFVFLRYAAPAR